MKTPLHKHRFGLLAQCIGVASIQRAVEAVAVVRKRTDLFLHLEKLNPIKLVKAGDRLRVFEGLAGNRDTVPLSGMRGSLGEFKKKDHLFCDPSQTLVCYCTGPGAPPATAKVDARLSELQNEDRLKLSWKDWSWLNYRQSHGHYADLLDECNRRTKEHYFHALTNSASFSWGCGHGPGVLPLDTRAKREHVHEYYRRGLVHGPGLGSARGNQQSLANGLQNFWVYDLSGTGKESMGPNMSNPPVWLPEFFPSQARRVVVLVAMLERLSSGYIDSHVVDAKRIEALWEWEAFERDAAPYVNFRKLLQAELDREDAIKAELGRLDTRWESALAQMDKPKPRSTLDSALGDTGEESLEKSRMFYRSMSEKVAAEREKLALELQAVTVRISGLGEALAKAASDFILAYGPKGIESGHWLGKHRNEQVYCKHCAHCRGKMLHTEKPGDPATRRGRLKRDARLSKRVVNTDGSITVTHPDGSEETIKPAPYNPHREK